MTSERAHPFDLVFGELAGERFPPIREAVGDGADLDAWLMSQPVVELLTDLRPGAGLGEAVDDFVLFTHAAYRWWEAGRCTIAADRLTLPLSSVMYIQVEPRRIWAQLGEDDVHEPLDGWFAIPDGGSLGVVACLGVHRSRPGLSVLTARGPQPRDWRRADGSATFSPLMCGGAEAGLRSIAAPEELLLLAWGISPEEAGVDGGDGPERDSIGD